MSSIFDPSRTGGDDFQSIDSMFAYHSGALVGSPAYAATSSSGRLISISVVTSMAIPSLPAAMFNRLVEYCTIPDGMRENEAHTLVLSLLERGQADQDAFAERLSPAERAAVGELHAWTAKDQIAHNNFWREDAILRLEAALGGTEPRDTESDEAETLRWNDRNFEAQRD